MIRVDTRESVGEYLSRLTDLELTHFPGRERYERVDGETNHRSGFRDRRFTFFIFPEEEWISLRTTNVIERLNKEFKRRTKTNGDACWREYLLHSPACRKYSFGLYIYYHLTPLPKPNYTRYWYRYLMEVDQK